LAKQLILRDVCGFGTEPITTEKIIEKNRFHPDGVYSERIFGPVKDYICSCGIYSPYGGRCQVCGVSYVKSETRSTTFGHIPLPIKIINPLFMWSLSSRAKSTTKIDVNGVIMYRNFIIFENDKPIMLAIEDYESMTMNVEHYIGADAIVKILEWIDVRLKENPKFKIQEYIRLSEYKLLMKYREFLVLDRVLVVPPDLRPILFTGNKMSIEETLTRMYTTLLTKINIMKNKTKFVKDISSLTFKNYADVQMMAQTIYEEILTVFGGKKGIIRGNILGKRIDYSGRAVIAVDPSLKYNECRIPYYILLEVYKYQLAREIAKKKTMLIFDVLNEIEESLKVRDYRFFDEVVEFTKDRHVLLNRQPTLHKYGLLGWKIKVSSDSTIKVHPFSCSAYNSDFDGDCCLSNVELITDQKIQNLNKTSGNKIQVHMDQILSLDVET